MTYDEQKIADTVLALLSLTIHEESEFGSRAWKSHDWNVLDHLHQRGLIDDPKNKNKSVWLTADGVKRSRELFDQMFGVRDITTRCTEVANGAS
jgi:uncharacterized protein DUF6429